MQIRAGLSQILNMNFAAPPQAVARAQRHPVHEMDNRTSRHVAHVKKEKEGWKMSKHDMHMNRQKKQMQNRGSAHKLGDARAARGY